MINKTVYIPTEEDIYNLEIIKRASGVNNIDIYGYLIAKTIEKLISNNKFISNIDSYLLEIPEIVHGICWLYPQELFSSSTARQDYDLCSGLLTKQTDQTIYNLDNVSKFDKNIQLNYEIKQKVIKILEEKIISTPEYRFTYQQGVLLDAIFGVKAEEFNNLPVDIQVKLANIDPTYVLKLNLRDLIRDVVGKDKIVKYRQNFLFTTGLRQYLKQFDLKEHYEHEYYDIDYRKPENEKAKRLLKYLYK